MIWIETSKELPKFIEGKNYSKNVIVWNNNNLEIMCYCKSENNTYHWSNAYGKIDGDTYYDDDYSPSHWMNLPSSPNDFTEKINYKEKFIISKTTLEAILFYIVPDDCRALIYKTLDELK